MGRESGGRRKRKGEEEGEELLQMDERSFIDRRRLGDLIDTATTSPLLQLDDRALSSIKALVRSSDANVNAAFDLLLDKLKKNHSQVRYLAVLLMDELFTRSKLFRSLLVPVFETFLLLGVGFRSDYPLPPPQDRATLLRKKTVEVVEKWKDMFGQHYKPLRLAYDYLKGALRLEFPNARELATLAEQQRREREERTQELLLKKFHTLKEDIVDLRSEIQSTVDQIAECLAILAPTDSELEETRIDADSDEDEFEEYGARSLRLLRDEVEEQDFVPQESVENAAVFDTLRDLYKLLATRHLVSTQEWLTTLIRVDPKEERPARDSLLKEIVDLRNQLLKCREKCEGLGVERIDGVRKSAGGGEELDDVVWEEGDVWTSEEILASSGIEIGDNATVAMDTGSNRSAEGRHKEKIEEGGIKGELRRQAPVLPWGSFLERWGNDSAVLVNPRGMEFENHWGKVDYDRVISAETIAANTLRSSYYKTEQTEIRPCLAPLRKGGLCQRRDLKKCPFHGPIVPRDSKGCPIVEEEKHSETIVEDKSMPRESTMEAGVSGSEVQDLRDPASVDSENGLVDLAVQAIANVRGKDEAARKRILEEKSTVRRQRAKRAREHNDSCLRAAAIATTSQGFGEVLGGALDEHALADSRQKKPRGGLIALLRKKPTAKDRLARRLLNGRVTDATVSQLTRDQEAAYRESFPNQWTMK